MRQRILVLVLALLIPAAFFAGRLADRGGAGPGTSGERKVLYWVDPMNPSFRSPEPGIAPCGMPLEPVYADGVGPGAANGSAPGAVAVRTDRLQLIGVAREQVRVGTVRHTLRLVGAVAPDETRLYTISAASQGRALEMGAATTGSLVVRGEVLGAYYSQDLIVPQQNFIRMQQTTDALRRTGVNKYDNMQGGNQMANYERNLLFARQALLNLGMSPEQVEEVAARGEVSYLVQIRAPAAGIILSRRLSLGQSFNSGEELFRIADLDNVWILADALGGEERFFTPGMKATVTVPGTGQSFPAVVSRVLPQFAAETRTLKVRFEARNPGFVLRPDMFVDVELPLDVGPGIFLPKEAVLDSGTRQVVFVEQGPGVFIPRTVRTGRRFAERVEIVAGLMDGETVVTSGNFLLDSESRMRAAGAAAAGSVSMDPVCGMEVEEAKARSQGLVSEHAGRTWFFCSSQCKQAFERDPKAAAAKVQTSPAAEPVMMVPAVAPIGPVPGKSQPSVPHGPNQPAGHGAMSRGMPPAAEGVEPSAMPDGEEDDFTRYVPGGVPGGLPRLHRDEGPAGGAVGWQTPLPVPRDPVCGMEVDLAASLAAGLVSKYGRETFYFCTPACKKEFDDNPVVFVQTSR